MRLPLETSSEFRACPTFQRRNILSFAFSALAHFVFCLLVVIIVFCLGNYVFLCWQRLPNFACVFLPLSDRLELQIWPRRARRCEPQGMPRGGPLTVLQDLSSASSGLTAQRRNHHSLSFDRASSHPRVLLVVRTFGDSTRKKSFAEPDDCWDEKSTHLDWSFTFQP